MWLFALQVAKQVQKNLLITYILYDQVWWSNIKQFLSCSEIYNWTFMQTNYWCHQLFHIHLSFWIRKVWKGRGKITKSWISRERKELFRWNQKHFSQFLKGYHLVKKHSGHKRSEYLLNSPSLSNVTASEQLVIWDLNILPFWNFLLMFNTMLQQLLHI